MLVGIVDTDPSSRATVGLPGIPFTIPCLLITSAIKSAFMRRKALAFAVGLIADRIVCCVNNDPDDGLPNFQEYTYYRNAHLHTCRTVRTDPYETNSIIGSSITIISRKL